MKLKAKPTIIVDEKTIDAIFNIAEKPLEWTLYAKSEQSGPSEFYITEVIVPYQENTTTNTEVPPSATHKDFEEPFDATLEWRTRGRNIKDPKTWRSDKEWNTLIHSHNKMGVFWSGTDETEMMAMADERTTPFISIVVNQKKEYLAMVCYPELGLRFDECQILKIPEISLTNYLLLDEQEQQKIKESIQKTDESLNGLSDEIDKKEIKKVYRQTTGVGFNNYNANYNYNNYAKKNKKKRNEQNENELHYQESYFDPYADFYDAKLVTDIILEEDGKVDQVQVTKFTNNKLYLDYSEAISLEGEGYYLMDIQTGYVNDKINIEEISPQAAFDFLKTQEAIIYLREQTYFIIDRHIYWPKGSSVPKELLKIKY